MVILVIDKNRVYALEDEGQTPVAADPDGPVSGQVRRERMQLPAGQVHVLRGRGKVQARQLPPKFRRVGGLDARLRSGLEEALKPFVPRKRSIGGRI